MIRGLGDNESNIVGRALNVDSFAPTGASRSVTDSIPTVETVGYCRVSLPGQRRLRRRDTFSKF